MTASFLSLVATEILRHGQTDLSSVCVVFPTRRAALWFRKELACHLHKPVLAPEILSIKDFVQALCPFQVSETIPLLFPLYRAFRSLFPEESFHQFFHWGNMLLRDLNELDLQQADPQKLFATLSDLKRIDQQFGWEQDEIKAITEFWHQFSLTDPGILRQSFLQTWQALPRILKSFKEELNKHRMASEGLAWHLALEHVQRQGRLAWKKIFFCGFYHVTRVHESVVSQLKQRSEVIFLYDADRYYTDDEQQEAGHGIRELSRQNHFRFLSDNFNEEKKTIYLSGVPLHTMQAKLAGYIIRQWLRNDPHKSMAVILPDEKILLPLLNSLPSELNHFNVTMGFPLWLTQTGSFVELLYQLHVARPGSLAEYPVMQLMNLLSHPLLPISLQKSAPELQAFLIRIKTTFVCLKDEQWQEWKNFLQPAEKSASGILNYLIAVLSQLRCENNHLEQFVTGFLKDELVRLIPFFSDPENNLDMTAAWYLIRQLIRQLRIPFSGEPLSGLQIMGLLETQAIDFDRVIILSVNEGILPPASMPASFIPYSLRGAFHLPLPKDHDAMYAYYFYRLLQRAQEVHLIYDSEGKEHSGGEMSRFALQLSMEAEQKTNGQCKVIHRHYAFLPEPVSEETPIILKSQDMIEEFCNQIRGPKHGLSATALTTYLACRLRFYFRYVAGIKEPEEIEVKPGPEVLGNLIHSAMEFLYNGKKDLEKDDIIRLKDHTAMAVDHAFARLYPHVGPALSGYHLLNYQIAHQLVNRILDTDAHHAPFSVLALEKEFNKPLSNGLTARGIADKILMRNNIIEILDYKTGNVSVTNQLDKLFTGARYKTAFQLFYYAMLVKHDWKPDKIRIGFYRLRSLSAAIEFINDGQCLTEEMISRFEERIEQLTDEILNPVEAFSPTDDRKECEYCPYKTICKR